MKDDYKEEYQKHFNLLQECILNQDPKEWNKEFAPRKISPFLSGQIIGKEEVTSPKTVIKGFKFNDAVFENTKFYNIRFINCVFYNCDFAVAKIYQCIFENSEIKDCKFKGSTIEKNKLRTTMGRFELLGNNFRGANLIENDFSNTNCRESNFSCRIIKDTSFNSADLSNCIFVRTRMLNCEFVKANISYAIFNNCQIRKSEFIDCIAVGTLFSGEERLSNSDFSNKQEKYTIKKGSALEVNNIETSQFIRMISQDRLHEIINEVTENAVLILGSFHIEHM
ncbi:MAG: pentapeptide repeat-containing protein, partial [Bacteroidota bacterium]